MAIAGRPIETTFTPGVAGVVKVTVTYELVWDVGGGSAAVVCEQSSVITYGPFNGPEKYVRQPFTASFDFAVTAGSLVKVGLAAQGPGLRRMSFYNLSLVAAFIPS